MVSYLLRFFLISKLRALLGVMILMVSLVGCNPQDDSTNDIHISSLSSISGTINGGNTITITGSGFTFIEGVTFDQSQCTGLTVVNSTTITCTVPPHSSGTVTVRVYGLANRSASTSYSYLYVAPTITSFSPSAGKLAGGTTLFITGTGFFDGAAATVGGTNCGNVSVISSTLASCTLPAKAAGSYSVELTNIDALSGTSATSYTYQVAPTVTSVSPTSGLLAGGPTMTVTGTGFLTGATVKIGSVACANPTVVSSTSITCVIPNLSVGVYSVSVTNSDAQLGTLTSAYIARAAPTITSSYPSVGPVTGGTMITITGTGFYTGASVTINGVACIAPTVVTSSSITCTTPVNAPGSYTLAVTNADAQTGIKTSGFLYQAAPTVTSISPISGALAGGGILTLTGTGFLSGASVLIGATTCATPVVVSSTSMTCILPAKTAGAYNATVTNSDTQTGALPTAYTYQVAPTVSSVAPLTGPIAGGTTITITGTDFISGATITVDGSTCTTPAFVDSTTLTCDTPAHAAGAVSVVVTNPDSQVGPLASAFTYQAAPTVTSVSPLGGDAAGGTTITITGTGFIAGAIVDLDSVPCTSPTFVNSTTLTCVTAAHASGVVQIDVTNTDSQVGGLVSAYTYLDAPTVTSVAPNAGALAGGSAVTITGTGFFAGATVDFDGISCTGVTVVSDTSITCTTGAHAAGAVNVTVTNIDTQSGIGTSVYTYQVAPTVSSVSPSYGPIGGATNITITGSDFLAGATVNVGANPCTSVVIVSSTSITCNTAFSVTSGTASVSVTNLDGQSHGLTSGFLYILPPSISSISPNAGPLAGGTTITISGSSFFTGATVTVGATPCTSPTVVSPTSITCTLPTMGAGAYDVVVTNPDNQLATASSAYTYQVPPTIISVDPASGALVGGTSITVTGTDFVTGATAKVGGLPCSSVVVSSTSLTCVTPTNNAGTYGITVTNADGQNDSVSGLYTYQAAPIVASVSPASGALAGGTLITITGANFISGAAVNVGASACTGVSVVSSTSITCNTPANATGVYSITVTNLDNQSGELASAFTYQAAPTVTSLSPNIGALAGGTTVTFSGTNFLSGAIATIGGSACMSPTVVSSSSLTCTLPSKVAGAYTATVTNVDTQTGSLVSAYTYQTVPTVTSISPNVGPLAGGTVITITGTGFLAGATAAINGTSCTSLAVISSSSITCTTQAKAAGIYSLTVTNSDAQSGTLATAFTYQAAPTITSVSPSGGALAGGNTVTVSGSGFLAGLSVDFGGSACNVVSVAINGSSLTCTPSAHAAGPVTVTVTNNDSQYGSVASGYTYRAAPTVTSVSANSGVQAGGTPVIITGTGFLSGATAFIDGLSCTGVDVVNSTTITCSTPAHAAGPVPVSVTNSDGQSGIAGSAYTYTAIPVLAFQVGAASPNPPSPDSYGSTTTNVTHTFTVINSGEGTSSLITISLLGADPAAFLMGTDNCTGFTLVPAATCTVQLTFLGGFLSTGTYSAILNTTATSGGTVTNSVSGSVP